MRKVGRDTEAVFFVVQKDGTTEEAILFKAAITVMWLLP